MVSQLSTLREGVAAALTEAGLNGMDYVGERTVPPLAAVVPDAPYVQAPEGATPFGHYDVRIQVLLVGGKGTNQANADDLDDRIERALVALSDEYDVTEVSQPAEVQINGSAYVGAVLSIEQTVRLG